MTTPTQPKRTRKAPATPVSEPAKAKRTRKAAEPTPIPTPSLQNGPTSAPGARISRSMLAATARAETETFGPVKSKSIWVVGATANLDYAPLVFHDDGADTPLVDGTTKFATVDTVISAGARLGVKTNPSTLIYAKAAIAGINTHANADFFALGGGGSAMLPAVQFGAGVETAIADQVTLGIEGNYTAATSPLVTENTQANQVELWPTLLTGKVTLKYHF